MSRRFGLLAVLLWGACDPGNGSGMGHTHDPGTLVRVDDEPEGANCAGGGVAIHTGVDTNLNGTLDNDEITSTSYVCGIATLSCPAGAGTLTGVVTVRSSADFAQLDGITCIGGDLIIAGVEDAALPALDLETVTGGVVVAGNQALASLDGFANLTTIGRTYAIQGNDSLVDVSSLGLLDRVGSLIIVGNDSLLDLAGMEVRSELVPNLTVSNNASLQSLNGLQNIVTADQGITIRANRNLTSVAALANLKTLGLGEISGNSSLATVELTNLQKVDVRLLVNANAVLTSISMPALATTTELQFQNNPALQSISIPTLVVLNTLHVQANTSLTTLSVPTLSFATGLVMINTSPNLTTVDFGELSAIGGTFYLSALGSLATLSGFANLRDIAGDFVVSSCNALQDLSGLTSLETVSGNMLIQTNTQFSDFGMGSFSVVDGNLTISSNPALPLATAQSFVAGITVHGSVTIN